MSDKFPKSKIFILMLASAWIFFVSSVQAARIFPEIKSFQENGNNFFKINIFLDTEGEDINVLTGKMSFSAADFSFEKIQNGGSVVNLWIEDPKKSAEGEISFSGGIPNGYLGSKGYLFSAIFSSSLSSIQQAEIAFRNVEVYVNDGKGTKKMLPEAKNTLNLENAESTAIPADREAPEVFAPYVTSDSSLEGGKWVAIFNAQDKGSGIDHYEIVESAKRYDKETVAADKSIKWKAAQNLTAHVLDDQNLKSYIYVKAVDKAGNVRFSEVIPAKNQEFAKFNYKILIFSILSIILGVIIFYIFIIFKRRKDGGTNR